MAVSHDTMEDTLLKFGCRSIHSVKKVTEYMLPKLKEPIYFHKENNDPKIVIRPVFDAFRDELETISGATINSDSYHNADMTRFPKRLHTGKKEVHYGLAVTFENSMAIEKFLTKLSKIAAGS